MPIAREERMLDTHRNSIKSLLRTIGYDVRHWTRPMMFEKREQWLEEHGPRGLDACTLRPSGHFLGTTPFGIKVHDVPCDSSRSTETSLCDSLAKCGFPPSQIRTASWRNRACVKANLKRWARRGFFRSLKNEPEFPVVVWALATKPE